MPLSDTAAPASEIVFIEPAARAPGSVSRLRSQGWRATLSLGALTTLGLPGDSWPTSTLSLGGVIAFSGVGSHLGVRMHCASTFIGQRTYQPPLAERAQAEIQWGHCGAEGLFFLVSREAWRVGAYAGGGVERRSVGTTAVVTNWGMSHNAGLFLTARLTSLLWLETNVGGTLRMPIIVTGVEVSGHAAHLTFDVRITVPLDGARSATSAR